MKASLRLQTLLGNLTQKEINWLDNFIDNETHYGKLYHKIRNNEPILDLNHKINKSITDSINHLEEKVLEGLLLCSEDEWVKELVELCKIRVLLNNDISDFANNKLTKLYDKINPKEELLKAILLNWSFNSIKTDDKVHTSKVISVLKQINGFWDKENLIIGSDIDLVNFIEHYKGFQNSIKDKYDLLWKEYRLSASFKILDSKTVIQFKTLLEIINYCNKYKNELFDSMADYEKGTEEIFNQLKTINLPTSLSEPLTYYFLRDFLENEQEISIERLAINLEEVDLINDSIIDDVVIRVEVKSLIFKILEFNWLLDRKAEKAIKYYKTIQGLLKKIQEYPELTLLLKYIECLIYKKIDDENKITSTYYKYQKELKDSGYFKIENKSLIPIKGFLYFKLAKRAFDKLSGI
jgi:hypothetical protein